MSVVSRSETIYRETRNVVYGEAGGAGLVMDVFSPAQTGGPARGLGIICVTSGGWNSDRAMVENYRNLGTFDAFCSRGYTVFAARPGSVPVFTAIEMLDNVRAGIRYVKDRAGEYGIAPDRIGLFGVSAGGHLACLAAARVEQGDPGAADPLLRHDTVVQAVAAFCPPTDFLNWSPESDVVKLAKGSLSFRNKPPEPDQQQMDEALRAISPVCHVKPGLPPFRLVHGGADSLVPFRQSELLANALRNAGNSVQLIEKPGAEHGWPTIREDVEETAEWFNSMLVSR
ncbi:MAG TPA: alpha/beta hydrolase [Candidatus Brocadiia bacterium]|nr:alpha/beta hydrolase [Candidatus Brocadiia bacterium]